MSSGFLHVFLEFGNLNGTSNYVLYWIHGVACSDSISHNRVQVLRISLLLLSCSEKKSSSFVSEIQTTKIIIMGYLKTYNCR